MYHPLTEELLVEANGHIDDVIAKKIGESPIESIEVRSPLTCEAKKGICVKCYGRNLATGKMVQRGEAVGVVAAQFPQSLHCIKSPWPNVNHQGAHGFGY